MAIRYTTTGSGYTLTVVAEGFDEDLEDVNAYAKGIVDACVSGGYTRVLCDESRLEYRLRTLDTFDSATALAAYAPRLARIAIVCDERFINDAAFWETCVVNRGLKARVFKDVVSARTWLAE